MHTRQGAAVPAQPNHNHPALTAKSDDQLQMEITRLRALLAPNWAPLEMLCPSGLCEQFMFMGSANGIFRYKHIDSRRYLNVDAEGLTYAFNPDGSHYPISVASAMLSLAGGPSVEGLFSRSEIAAIMRIVAAAKAAR